jgi:hypothetical protein
VTGDGLYLAVVTELLRVFFSPIGPALVLLMGAALQLIVGRWLRRAVLVRGLALLVVGVAALLFLLLQFLSVTPTLGQPWQPLLQTSINLFWISDGWNNYIAGLILLLGGLGILLDRAQRGGSVPIRFYTVQAMNLAILAASQLFVTSGNLLTALFAWVFLDFTVLLRTAAEPAASSDEGAPLLRTNEAQLLSLVGALILLIGLLPAGATGPAQEFPRGVLPTETLIALLVAAAIRTGVYPVHLWLLPRRRAQVILSERLLGHMAPMLCGLWLFGWTYHLGGAALLTTPLAVLALTLLLLASAVAAWTADDQPHHATFVLVTAAGVAVLAGVLAHTPGPAGIVWATTAFALGGGLWLVGDQVWQAWGWQAPVTVGAAALAGVAFTPGFLAQPALASLLTRGPLFWPAAAIFILAMSIQIAALLRSWSAPDHAANGDLPQDFLVRLLVACVALGLPLAVAGILPVFMESIMGIPNTIAPALGNPPSAVAAWPVWAILALPLLFGLGLVQVRPRLWPSLGAWPNRLSRLTQLEWLFRATIWGVDRMASLGANGLAVVEGAGALGWFMVFVLLAALLLV